MADYSRIKVSQDDTELTLEIYYREYILYAPKNYLTEEKKKWIESLPNQPFSINTIYKDLAKQPVHFEMDQIHIDIAKHFAAEKEQEDQNEQRCQELDYNENNPYLESEIDEMRKNLEPFQRIREVFKHRVLFILNALDVVGIVPSIRELDWNFFVTNNEEILGRVFNGDEKIITKKLTHDGKPSVEVQFLNFKKVFEIGNPKSNLAKLVAKLEEAKLEEAKLEEAKLEEAKLNRTFTLADIVKQHKTNIFHNVDNSQATPARQLNQLDLIFGNYNVYRNTLSDTDSDSHILDRFNQVQFSIELID